MKQIQRQDIRRDLAMQLTGFLTRPLLGGSQDAATAFAMAADADALATRLMDCADARLSLARGAVWGLNPDALYFNPPAALNQSARALLLIEKAGEAKRFSEYMLYCALVFEDAASVTHDPNWENDSIAVWIFQEASSLWSALMSEGIFSPAMYSEFGDLN